MLGPKKELPPVTLPSTYVEENNLARQEDNLQNWWEQFQDPLLSSLVQEALQKNFDVMTAVEKINQVRALLTISSSKLFPSLGFFGFPARIKTSKDLTPVVPSFTPGTGTTPPSFSLNEGQNPRNFFALGFDAAWELDFFGKNRSNKQQAYYNLKSSEEKVNFIKIMVIAEVAEMYTEIRSLQQRIIVTKKRIHVFEKLLDLTKNLNLSGLKSALFIQNKIAALNQAKSLERPLQEALDQSISSLAFLLGGELSDYKERFKSVGNLPFATGKVPLGLPSDLLKRRPDIKQAEFNLYAAGASIGYAKASLFPSISLTGVIGNSSKLASHLFKSTSNFWAVIPDIDWSLFQGGRLLAQVDVANSQQKEASIAYEKTVLNALKEVENSLIGYSQSSLKTQDLLLEYKAKKEILSLSKCLVKSGLADLLSLLDVYQDLFTSQENYISAKEEAMTNLISLYKALGGSWQSSY